MLFAWIKFVSQRLSRGQQQYTVDSLIYLSRLFMGRLMNNRSQKDFEKTFSFGIVLDSS